MPEDAFTRIAARADLCRLLAACFYQPGPEFTEEDVFGSLHKAATQVDPALAELASALGAAFAAQPLLELQVEHTRLFVHPSGAVAAPYESVWLAGSGAARSEDIVDSVRAAYRAGGYDVDDDFRDLPDHIAAELEFVYTLIFREARGRALGDAAAEQEAVDLRQRFVEAHLGRWTTPFALALKAEADSAYYRTLAELTERFVLHECT